MLGTLQSKFNVNKSNYVLPPTTKSEIGTTESSVTSDKNNQNVLWYSLAGLAVLGSGGLFVGKKLTKKPSKEINQAADNIIDIIRLRLDIKEKFIAKREEIVNKWNSVLEERNLSQEIPSITELMKIIPQKEAELAPKITQFSERKATYGKLLREKITTLSSDKEWHELRDMRKKFIKAISNEGSVEEANIAYEKADIINDLLIAKVYPDEVRNFKELYCMEPSTAVELMKKDFTTAKDYEDAFAAAQTIAPTELYPSRDRSFNHLNPLRLTDVFPDEARVYAECRSQINDMRLETKGLKDLWNGYLQDLKVAASEVRNSDEVRKLKDLLSSRQK